MMALRQPTRPKTKTENKGNMGVVSREKSSFRTTKMQRPRTMRSRTGKL